MNKLLLKPGKAISQVSVFVLIFMLVFGIAFALIVGNVLAENEAPPIMTFTFSILIILWIGTVLFMLIYQIKNSSGSNAQPLIEIENDKSGMIDPVKTLRELESLKKDGILSDVEYETKRKQILDKKW